MACSLFALDLARNQVIASNTWTALRRYGPRAAFFSLASNLRRMSGIIARIVGNPSELTLNRRVTQWAMIGRQKSASAGEAFAPILIAVKRPYVDSGGICSPL